MNTGVTDPVYGELPSHQISSFSGILGAARTSRRGPTGGVDLVESVSYLRGKHAFKFGFEYLDQFLTESPIAGLKARRPSRHCKIFCRASDQVDRFFGQSQNAIRGATGSEFMLRMIGA